MKRALTLELESWRTGGRRKPLLLRGPRQVGKTWLLKEFGRSSFEDVAYFNLEATPSLSSLFESTKDPLRLVEMLSVMHGRPVRPGNTLLILDEIQESNEALNSLKYFMEDLPDLHVACAGSLLGIALSRPGSFPVGKVDFLDLRPLTFTEFLQGVGDASYVEFIEDITDLAPVPEPIESHLYDRLSHYLMVGGMPEPADIWATDANIEGVARAQRAIIDSYELDFAKHAPAHDAVHLRHVWSSIPSQLARENKKFVYGAARPGARARQYESALHWLSATGLAHRVNAISVPRVPLASYDEASAFKLYSLDCGLLARQSGLDPSAFSDPHAPFTEFRGALTENLVLQSLVARFDRVPRYWRSEGQAEVEFLLERNGDIHPIEVKAGRSVRSRSLGVYRERFEPRLAVRLSRRGLHHSDGLLDVPLYLIDQLDRLIQLALEG